MQMKMRTDLRSIAAVTATSATLACVLTCCLATTRIGCWYTWALICSVGVGFTLLPYDGGYFRLLALLCVLQGIAFTIAAILSATVGGWFYAGLALSIYQLIWGSSQEFHRQQWGG